MTALQNLADRVDARLPHRRRFDADSAVLLDDAATASHLYRLAQEAVNNAVKYSGSPRIDVWLNALPHQLELVVRDYGLDVTSEHSTGARLDPFVGLQPMAWVYEPPAPDIPPSLYCGTPMPPKLRSELIRSACRDCWSSSASRRPRKSGPMPGERQTTTTRRKALTGSASSRGLTATSRWSQGAELRTFAKSTTQPSTKRFNHDRDPGN